MFGHLTAFQLKRLTTVCFISFNWERVHDVIDFVMWKTLTLAKSPSVPFHNHMLRHFYGFIWFQKQFSVNNTIILSSFHPPRRRIFMKKVFRRSFNLRIMIKGDWRFGLTSTGETNRPPRQSSRVPRLGLKTTGCVLITWDHRPQLTESPTIHSLGRSVPLWVTVCFQSVHIISVSYTHLYSTASPSIALHWPRIFPQGLEVQAKLGINWHI